MMMTGTVGSISLTRVRSSRPSPCFMRRSVTTTSAGCRANASSAAAPLSAISAISPAASRSLATVRAMSTTSSTTSTRSLRASGRHACASYALGVRRPQHGRGRPRPRRAGEIDPAAMVAHDAGRDRQPQPGSLAPRLGREERIEDRLQVLGRDARALIDDPDADHPAVRREGFQADVPIRLRGIARVEEQVHQHLLQLIRVGGQHRQVVLHGDVELDVARVQLPGQKLARAIDGVLQRHRPALRRRPAREIENLTDGRRDVVDVLDDDVQILRARAAAHLAQHLLGAAANHRQRAADLVRHLRRQHADRDQLLGAHQLVLQIARRRHGARIAQLVLEGQGAALLPQDEEPDARDRERRADRRDDDPRQQPGLRDP